MKIPASELFLVLLGFTALLSWAGELPPDATLPKGVTRLTQKDRAIYDDLKSRLETAIASRELASVAALYQTNGVAPQELKLEMARWPSLLDGDAKVSVALYFKELSTLPPQAREFHTERARRLTKHEVTHLALVHLSSGYQLTLPLVRVGDSLLIVPSEKILNKGIEPNGATNGSQPIRSETNPTPPAAGSRR